MDNNSPNSRQEVHPLSPRDRLLAHSSSLLGWLNQPEARLFNEWLRDLRLRENKKLMEASDEIKVFRAQGSVGIIDLILTLEDDLHQYISDVASGNVKPIKEGAPQNAR